MKNKCNLPWFVLNNRQDPEKTTNVVRERRAIVMCVAFMVLIGGLLALSAAYCRTVFNVIMICGFLVGFATMIKTVFLYCKGE